MGNLCLVNVCTPSGSANRADREFLFNFEVVELFPHSPIRLIWGRDFNCVLSNSDCMDSRTCSRTLGRLTHGLRLIDAWYNSRNPQGYNTQYTAHGAARLDRFYLTDDMLLEEQGAEVLAADFSDHLAVLLRLTLLIHTVHRGRGTWRMNMSLLTDEPFHLKLRDAYTPVPRHIALVGPIFEAENQAPFYK